MGQDYWILNADKKLILDPLQYDAGGKMFEHCFIGNSYLYELLHLLAHEWKGDCVFNNGDYATDFPEKYNLKYEFYNDSLLKYRDECDGSFRVLNKDSAEQLPSMWSTLIQQYVFVNYDQKIYCTIDCCPVSSSSTSQICPVPLLLSNSDTIAGGDYASFNDYDHVGSWRYNHVGVELKQWEHLSFMTQVDYAFSYWS